MATEDIRRDFSRAVFHKDWEELTDYQVEDLKRHFYKKYLIGFEDFVSLIGTDGGKKRLNECLEKAEQYDGDNASFKHYKQLCVDHHFVPMAFKDYIGYIARIYLDEDRLRKKFEIIEKKEGNDAGIFYFLNKRNKDFILMALSFNPEIFIINIHVG